MAGKLVVTEVHLDASQEKEEHAVLSETRIVVLAYTGREAGGGAEVVVVALP